MNQQKKDVTSSGLGCLMSLIGFLAFCYVAWYIISLLGMVAHI